MHLFHRHKFDSEKWELISRTAISKSLFTKDGKLVVELPKGDQLVYKNTCLDCGDLVFRRVKEMSK